MLLVSHSLIQIPSIQLLGLSSETTVLSKSLKTPPVKTGIYVGLIMRFLLKNLLR